VPRLANVVFQERLGTLHDRAERISALAALVSERTDGDPGEARLAGRLAKCDLLTDMVGEFPELQGTMGRYYALNDGLPEAVAVALEEQYLPRFAGDTLPATPAGRAVALADKLDLLVGIFGIGQRPSGDRDPYGLRRAALGVLRIVLEGELELDLAELLAEAAAHLDGRLSEKDTTEQVLQFLFDRLRGHYLDAGFTPDLFEAVVALRPTRPLDFDRRLSTSTGGCARSPRSASCPRRRAWPRPTSGCAISCARPRRSNPANPIWSCSPSRPSATWPNSSPAMPRRSSPISRWATTRPRWASWPDCVRRSTASSTR
jgi:glycyl-tRNA synthetase beta subunit